VGRRAPVTAAELAAEPDLCDRSGSGGESNGSSGGLSASPGDGSGGSADGAGRKRKDGAGAIDGAADGGGAVIGGAQLPPEYVIAGRLLLRWRRLHDEEWGEVDGDADGGGRAGSTPGDEASRVGGTHSEDGAQPRKANSAIAMAPADAAEGAAALVLNAQAQADAAAAQAADH
jgi:hypothetical protein